MHPRFCSWNLLSGIFAATLACSNAFSQIASGEKNAPAADKTAYEKYALQAEGDVANGRQLFSTRAACMLCHTVDGSSRRAGPDLSSIGDKFPRPELIRSVLEPSSTVAVGSGTTVLTRKSGGEAIGVVKQATEAWVELMGADGMPVRIENSDIAKQQSSAVSLMPEGLHTGLSLQEFADLVSYLQVG